MGETAENVAERWAVSRERQDAFALESQRRAVAAIDAGRFDDQIVPVEIPQKRGDPVVVARDEHPRADTTAEALARLRPAFKPEGGTVTAGNSSGINDGASAVLLVEAERGRALGLTPMARVVSTAVAGVDPAVMGVGPVPATRKALARAGIGVDDLDLIELNEAFASQSLVCIDELGLDPAQGQRQRRGDRARASARDERRPADHDAGPRAAAHRRPLRPRDDVHRRGPGDRDGRGAARPLARSRVAHPRPDHPLDGAPMPASPEEPGGQGDGDAERRPDRRPGRRAADRNAS